MKMKSLMQSVVVAGIIGMCTITSTTAQEPQTMPATTQVFGVQPNVLVGSANVDLSMVTNHAALVAYCFKQVQGVSVNVYCGSEVSDQGQRFYSYTNSVKSLDGIMALIANEYWFLQVTSPTDYFTLSVSFYNTNNLNAINSQNYYSTMLFTGGTSTQPVKNQYGQWALPSYGESVPMSLSYYVKIRIPNTQLAAARLIARDAYGNPYAVDMPIDGDGFLFQSQLAGNGVLVLSGWQQTAPNSWQWFQNAYSLVDGSPAQLTYVQAQVLLQGSSDFASYKNVNNLTTFIWTGSDYNGSEYGTVPLEIATFDQSVTNVMLNTYTSMGHYATSYQIEEQGSGKKITIAVPQGATSTTTGTNVLKGVYYIIPLGINLQSGGYYYGGKG